MNMMKKTALSLLSVIFLAATFVFAQDSSSQEDQKIPPGSYKSLSALPIVMFDNDIGFGYGAKARFVDYLKIKESFDLILFNSSKGSVGTSSLSPCPTWRSARAKPISSPSTSRPNTINT